MSHPSSHDLVNRLTAGRPSVVFAIEVLTTVTAATLAFLLRFDLSLPPAFRPVLLTGLLVWIPVKLLTFTILGAHRASWRYVSVHDALALLAGNVLASSVSAGILLTLVPVFPRSILVIHLLLCVLLTAGTRVAVRLVCEMATFKPSVTGAKRAVIYGAGDGGVALLREIRHNPALLYSVCGFVDDRPRQSGMIIHGCPVLGRGADLPSLAIRHGIDLALIAIPSASGAEMLSILQSCHAAGIPSKTVPGLGESVREGGLARQLRNVDVEDLLGRSPVGLEQTRVSAKLEGRRILVTGAAGSIGSELCRQIARFSPEAIIGFDIAESALFFLEQEFARTFPRIPFHPEIGSIQNAHRLAEVFDEHRPGMVYHAAAYKHVPLMEAHVFEAVENNIFGTLNVALAAGRHSVDDFVMISSDKAVRPTNVMGTTKRIAELVIRSLQNGGAKYVSVRFGNVLGSSGSVVPMFKEQIARGGPVTVTHPEMRRYFMTIPEACQLVLQSSTMGNGGEIFVLDMGEPVRILDLARNLILLSGLRPDEDIRIEYTGLRPGEKLFEELSTHDENTLPTYHEKIKIFSGTTVPWHSMESQLSHLQHLCAVRDFKGIILAMKELVPEFNPGAHLLRRALSDPDGQSFLARPAVGSVQ